jgi:hypothetical protein
MGLAPAASGHALVAGHRDASNGLPRLGMQLIQQLLQVWTQKTQDFEKLCALPALG